MFDEEVMKDAYDVQNKLLDKFLEKGDMVSLKKIFNKPYEFSYSSSKVLNSKRHLAKSMKIPKKLNRFKSLNTLSHNHFSNRNYTSDSNDLNALLDQFKLDNNDINNYKINFHNIIQDPDYKDKCMKGNYKWGTMKFNMWKNNWAKRRGISIDNFEVPKKDNNHKNDMIIKINGELIMNTGTGINNSNKYVDKQLNYFRKKLSLN